MKKLLAVCAAALLPLVVVQVPAQSDPTPTQMEVTMSEVTVIDDGDVQIEITREVVSESVQARAVCTRTITPSTPYRGYQESGYPAAIGFVSFYRSTGCRTESSWGAALSFYSCDILGYCKWRTKVSTGGKIKPGERFQIRMRRTCVDTSPGKWRTRGESPVGEPDDFNRDYYYSSTARIACDV